MEKLLEVLETLAVKLGTTVEQLAPHVVRHTQIKAIAAIVLFGVFSAVAFPLLLWRVRSALKRDWTGAKDCQLAGAVIPIITLSVICLACLIMGAIELPALIATAAEPVGATVKMLLQGAGK